MRCIVEWGVPKHAVTAKRPCGVSGQFIVESAVKASKLARQLYFTLTQGGQFLGSFAVGKRTPRRVVWSPDLTVWIAVSLLDGEPRGSYAALADKEGEQLLAEKNRLENCGHAQNQEHRNLALRSAVDDFLVKANGWPIHPSHLAPLKEAKTDDELALAVKQFLEKIDTGWNIHPSHLAPMRNAVEA